MTSNYQKGYALEREVRLLFEERGWYVVRAGQSRGEVDLLAVRKYPRYDASQVAMVQCKLRFDISPGEWNDLYRLAEKHYCRAVLAGRPKKGRPLVLMTMTGLCEPRKPRPMKTFCP